MSPEFARSAGQGGAEAAIIYGSIDRERKRAAAAISAGAVSSARTFGNARAGNSARTTSSAGASGSARATTSAGSGSARAAGSAREGGGEVTAELSHGEGRVAAPVGADTDKVKKAATHPFCDIQPLFHIVCQRRGDPGGKEQRAAERGGARIDEGADLTEELRHYL